MIQSVKHRQFILTLAFISLAFFLGTKFSTFKSKLIPSPKPPSIEELTQKDDVLPANVNLGISFGETILKMVKTGAIDKEKFLKRHPEADQLLKTSNTDQWVVNQDNSALLLNLLWPLGITNKSKVLSEGIMGTQYKDKVGSFASTGGWTLGSKDGGKLFDSQNLINLTPDQDAMVGKIAAGIYRPCCGNNTAFPDCNHGAGMLGFIELAVASGMPESEIYKKALVLNSYWFPQTYTDLAVFYKAKKNTNWKKVNPQEVLGAGYSSGQGYAAISKQLQTEGLLPKVSGGGGCGV